MADYWIRVKGRPQVRVDRAWYGTSSESEYASTPTSSIPAMISSSTDAGSLEIGFGIIERLEIRVEAVFRPNQKDVEVQYVLTGSHQNSPDKIHTLAANYIVEDADENSINIYWDEVVKSVRQERPEKMNLFIQVHSHPGNGIPEPSSADEDTWQNVSSYLSEAFPNAAILFGVHGVSDQFPNFIERTRPMNKSPNTLSWTSNTREHNLGFFSPSSTPCQVSYVD